MKKTLLTIAISVLVAVGVKAQGTVNYNIRVASVVVAHVYDSSSNGPAGSLSGNTAAETPTGTQVYTTALLQGSGFTAQLFSANGSAQAEGSLILVPTSTTTFRTG